MKRLDSSCLVFLAPLAILAFGLYVIFSSNNPDSRFCDYRIYRQADGSYEVWRKGRFNHTALFKGSYEAAKAYQVERCREFSEWLSRRPSGERVR